MKPRPYLLCFFLILTLSCTPKKSAEESALTESIAKGEAVYKQYCVACHMADGGGAPPMNPPLIGTSFVLGDGKVTIGILLNGMKQTEVDGETYHNVMPSMDYLSDEEIANVITYVRNSFGNKASGVTTDEVKSLRTK